MPIPLYNGLPIFGRAPKCETGPNERASQRNAYAGLTGVEHIDMGGRGRTSEVRGLLTGEDLAAFVAAKNLMESYNDGQARVFYDTDGQGWANVVMRAPKFGRRRSAGAAGFWCEYSVTLDHLSQV